MRVATRVLRFELCAADKAPALERRRVFRA